MEPESSSPYPQVTAIRPYSEPTPSSPYEPLQLQSKILDDTKDSIWSVLMLSYENSWFHISAAI